MTAYKLGFIGAGNMAQAIIQGALSNNAIEACNVTVYDVDQQKVQALADSLDLNSASDLTSLCCSSDIIVLAVKPNVMPTVLGQLKSEVASQSILSIAAGWSSAMICKEIGIDIPVCRVMPNTPLMAGEGMSVFESPCTLPKAQKEFVENIFSSIGKISYAPQQAMDAVTAVSGSGPAYVFMFIEALCDAGVLCGLPREQATLLAAQTVLGAAKMVLETGKHPGTLKDAVCSPGGTTIEAVKTLEHNGFRGTVIKAVEQCAKKSKALSES